MFDRLIDVLVTVWKHLLFFIVIEPYEQAVLCRLGQFVKVLDPGFHWVWPLGIDVAYTEHVTPRTERIMGLSTTSSDGKSIGFDLIITFRISDIRKAVLEVTEVRDAIADTSIGIVGQALHKATWEQILNGDALEELTSLCRRRGFRWGIEVMAVQLAGVALVRNIRLSHSGTQAAHQLHLSPSPIE
jgi:regulator of protease activity HflC (stomatin/prohibitin superfamily)